MSSTSRRLTRTNKGRRIAIQAARTKKNTPGPNGNFLTASTTTRLENIYIQYEAKSTALQQAAAALYGHTPQKDVAIGKVKTFVSHFLQVFNMGVTRGKYLAAHRAFFGQDVTSEALPPLVSESDIMLAAQNIVEGDVQRIAAGGAEMDNPKTSELDAERIIASNLLSAQSNLKDALDNAQEDVEGLQDEADKVIKKVWDEVETFYNEESDESRRENAREWGVVYITTGGPTDITGKATNATNQPVQGLTVLLVESDTETDGDENGDYKITTTLLGEATLRFSAPGFADQDKPITITEGQAMVVNVVMVAV
ncbi:MAG: carboxypeptidase-like regulatory domain-containing protein [Chitinophagales bacterium]